MGMRRGFSLVELSIVLVILGLLTGGILAGQSLIRAAALRSVSSEMSRYLTAIHTFRDKYFALPGDMTNATAFWGAQHATPSTCIGYLSGNPATGPATCNGNGNGRISDDDYLSGSNASWYEVWRAWQHLANAGLVEGSYTGVSDSTSNYAIGTAGKNIPASKVNPAAGYAFTWVNAGAGATAASWLYPGTVGNYLRFGSNERVDQGTLIKAEEAWNIDSKLDDGRPGTGRLRTYPSTRRPDCNTSDDPALAEYLLTSTASNACNLMLAVGL